MSLTTPVPGFGAKFYYGTAGSSYTVFTTGWTVTTNVLSYKPPEDKTKAIETLTFDGTAPVQTYIAGIVEPGEAEVVLQYDKTVFAALRALRGVAHVFRILLADGSGLGWAGYVSGAPIEVPMDGVVGMSIKVQVSGDHVPITSAS